MYIVTKAKANAVAYERPATKEKGVKSSSKKRATVKLKELFNTRATEFQTATVTM